MNHRRTPPDEVWRSPVVRDRDVWRELPDIHVRRRARRTFRWIVNGLVVALAAAVLLLISSPFFVLWVMPA